MPRAPLILTSEFPYHVTNRSNNKEFFYVPLEELWEIYIFVLGKIEKMYSCDIHAFVLMSNHYHLLISTPNENLGESMKYFHREVARLANNHANRMNHFFGGRYKWCVIESEQYYWNAYKYIFQNPVKAGIVQNVESYPFSSLNNKNKFIKWKNIDYFNSKIEIKFSLNWLNLKYEDIEHESISKAMRRRIFKLPRVGAKMPLNLNHINNIQEKVYSLESKLQVENT